DACAGIHQLGEEDLEGVAGLLVGADARGGQHHDQAERDEQGSGPEQQVVGRDGRAEPLTERGERALPALITSDGPGGHDWSPPTLRRTASVKTSPRTP